MKAIFSHGGRGLSERYTAHDGDGNSASIITSSGMQIEEKHEAAVRALCATMGWHGQLVGGHVLQAGRTVGRVWLWDNSFTLRLTIEKPAQAAAAPKPAKRAPALRAPGLDDGESPFHPIPGMHSAGEY